MRTAYEVFDIIEDMIEKGNPNSVTDAGWEHLPYWELSKEAI